MITLKDAAVKDTGLIITLAAQVWEPTYKDILSQEQLDFMFEMMYSKESLQRQMETLHHFLIAYRDASPLGFASYEFQEGGTKVKVHKLYVLPAAQGTGLGSLLLEEISARAAAGGAVKLTLNVNRHNKAYHFYIKEGFKKAGEEDIAIGNGYLMEDYIMEKQLL